MKKLLMVLAVGALLVACSSTQEKEAAAGFCECFNMNDTTNATNIIEIMEGTKQMSNCIKTWRSTYEGKITKDGLSEELKNQCLDAHAKAEEMGMFDE